MAEMLDERCGTARDPEPLKNILVAGLALYGNDAQILRGVLSHPNARTGWLFHDARHDRRLLDDIFRTVTLDGVIANVTDMAFARRLRRLRVPVVNVSGVMPVQAGFPSVTADHALVGEMAARYFLERHYRSFVIEPLDGLWYDHIAQEMRAFCKAVQSKGLPCFVLEEGVGTFHPRSKLWRGLKPPTKVPLKALPKPSAVFACMDRLGEGVCRLARLSNVSVPEQLAVLGADDFEFMCEMCYPPLSSIRLPGRQIGRTAAHLLDLLMRGETIPRQEWRIPPAGITTRRSTEAFASDDPVVARALVAIYGAGTERRRVSDIVRLAGVNRRELERRFRKSCGRSILQEIHSSMIERAVQLLTETNDPISEVAHLAGFRSLNHMGSVFRKRLHTTPRTVRGQSGYVRNSETISQEGEE